MNNYRKYWEEFEKRECVTKAWFVNNVGHHETETFVHLNYTRLIKLVSKHTGIAESEITWEICARWLLEDVQENIKLNKFEYDLIDTNDKSHDSLFSSFSTYRNMMAKGHFDGLKGYENKTLKWILEHCEVTDEKNN